MEVHEPVLVFAEACIAARPPILFKPGFRPSPQTPEIHGIASTAYLLDLAKGVSDVQANQRTRHFIAFTKSHRLKVKSWPDRFSL